MNLINETHKVFKTKIRAHRWHSVLTIPIDRAVMIKSVTGIVCLAKVQGWSCMFGERSITHHLGMPRIACFRRDGKGGDIMAVSWREPTR